MSTIEKKIKRQLADLLEEFNEYLNGLRTGRANPSVFESIQVDYYGTGVELKSIANVVIKNSLSIVIEPYNKSDADAITEAIQRSNLGYNPINEGQQVKINIPPMTEERRKQIVSYMRHDLEHKFKKRVRQIRQDSIHKVERNEEYSEDQIAAVRKLIQEYIDDTVEKLDKSAEVKEVEIMDMNQ